MDMEMSPSSSPRRPRPVRCAENEAVALHLFEKRRAMAEQPRGLSENLDMTLSTAYRNVCDAKSPIRSLKDLSQIKGVGKWILRLMKGFFPEASSDASPSKDAALRKGKKLKGPKRYVPQKNSAAYALLITLYREMIHGRSFMKKQELIDAAEVSGLSRTAIRPDNSITKLGSFGSSQRDWYTGWSCMKTLISKGLVVKSSNPAKYMLTDEGQEAARDCLSSSGLGNPAGGTLTITSGANTSTDGKGHSSESLSGSLHLGHKMEFNYISEVVNTNIQTGEVILSDSDSAEFPQRIHPPKLLVCSMIGKRLGSDFDALNCSLSVSGSLAQNTCELRSCSTVGSISNKKLSKDVIDMDQYLAMPPCQSGEKFHEAYDVILILDDRENFGSHSRQVVDNLHSQFNVPVEVRRLPVGDGLWIARHRQLNREYVLDFIVERKKVDDLCSSIRDNRYRDQKLRLQRCGLRKLIYLVEGDPNSLEAAESIKTACFTTEILEGFDVQRTSGCADTVRKYGHLTHSIMQYYSTHFSDGGTRTTRVCPSFDEFVRKCQDLEQMTVSDVFALQLMQVPQVTEEVALAIIEIYPTLLSLARAYSLLEGDIRAQEEMLKNKSSMVNAGASRNIFKLVWGSG